MQSAAQGVLIKFCKAVRTSFACNASSRPVDESSAIAGKPAVGA